MPRTAWSCPGPIATLLCFTGCFRTFSTTVHSLETQKIHERKLTSCLIGTDDNKSQIVMSTPRSREIFINCYLESDKLWHKQILEASKGNM